MKISPLKSFVSLPFILWIGLTITLNGSDPAEKAEPDPPVETGLPTSEKGMEWLQSWYDKIMESGGKVTEDAWTWIHEDWKRRGAWEYKVVIFDPNQDSTLEETLNELGEQRWECFWVGDKQDKLQLLFKRPRFSYLRSMPANDLLRFIPQGKDSE